MCGRHLGSIGNEFVTLHDGKDGRERSQRFALNFSIMYYSRISRKNTTRMDRQQAKELKFAMQKVEQLDGQMK